MPRPASPTSVPQRTPIADALRSGYALVTSPRLPLTVVGPADPERLLSGAIDDWRDVGSPVSLPVERFVLAGDVAGALAGAELAEDYDALARELRLRPGAVALVPLEAVDFRVQTLVVGGVDPLTSGEGVEPAARIGIVGDIVPGRNVHIHMERYGDFTRPFQRVAPLLRGFDLTVANLEGNLSATLPQPENDHSFSFVSSPAMLEGFALAGIDAVTLANNHTVWNDEGWGVQGLLDTMAALEDAGLPYFGAGYDLTGARAPWRTTVAGTSVAWLGIDGVTANYEVAPGVENGVVDFDAGATSDRPGTNPYLSAQFLEDISSAAAAANAVIPYFHMGAEYVGIPPAWAVAGARAAIDAGATMVVTNHPHVIQGMEIYNGRPIVYAPGNFIIDQMWGVEVRSGYALEVLLRGDRVVGLRIHGTEIEEFHQPRLMSAGE
ncbi:MAG TPA: CapA family protein [Thermomicrobiales bacterium]|nr:CapA family protein [Thermomicrobiales bacterium]